MKINLQRIYKETHKKKAFNHKNTSLKKILLKNDNIDHNIQNRLKNTKIICIFQPILTQQKA